jgi:hypothetical protein
VTPATACEDRGADLYRAAAGGAPDRDLADHLSACAGCRVDLERLRPLARDLPAASAGLAPRPATRVVLHRAAAGEAAAAPPAPPPPLRAHPARDRIRSLLLPVAALAAGVAAAVLALDREPAPPSVEGNADGAVTVTPVWGGAAVDGLLPAGLPRGALLHARKTASLRLGAPLGAEVVLGEGTRIRIPGGEAGRALDLEEGIAWFDPAGAPGARVPEARLRVRAGEATFEERGARFTVERRANGALALLVEEGVVLVRSGGAERLVPGPARLEVSPGAVPGEPLPAEAGDAVDWFAHPDLALEERPGTVPGEKDLVLVLRPAVPRRIRIAPWDRFDPLFSIRAFTPERGEVSLDVRPRMLRRPPPDADADGAFLLGPDRPYMIHVDPSSLGLPPGKVRLRAVYAASRLSGLWRGTRASNTIEIEVP